MLPRHKLRWSTFLVVPSLVILHLFIKNSNVWCHRSLEAVEPEPANCSPARWPRCREVVEGCFRCLHGCSCISKTYWQKQDLWFLPAESNCNLIVPWTWGQIGIYCEPQTHCKKLNPFGGYECKYTSLLKMRLTDSRNCFLLYILGE